MGLKKGYFLDIGLDGPSYLLGISNQYDDERHALVGVLDRKTVVIWNITGHDGEPIKIPGWQIPILLEQFAAILAGSPNGEPKQNGPCKFYGRRVVTELLKPENPEQNP